MIQRQILYVIMLPLTLLSIFITPHGLKLLKIPFISTRYSSKYIEELIPLQWKDLSSIHIPELIPDSATVDN